MQLHTLSRVTPNTKSKQVGRGGRRGKTSGRGTKGQNARSGRKKRPELRDFIKRIPKLRGRGVSSFKSIQPEFVVINLDVLETTFKSGDMVNPGSLVAKGVVSLYKGIKPIIKILATGEITKKITVSDCAVSASAKTKIEKAGGAVKVA
ncbi:50S ribosomal protein L15 [Patescibacteria group bacterium]|nr:MAG: 50S ribosomal protein L15 [Patescibacteria group bacterium]